MKKFIMALVLMFLFSAQASAGGYSTMSGGELDSFLEENRGKVIMLNFFATWCPPCRAEIPELVNLRSDYSTNELQILGLSVDEDAAAVAPFVDKAQVNYPIFMAGRDITDKLSVTSVPHNVFYDKNGKMIISEPGMADEKILKQVVSDLLTKN